jgi:hypothetical protein
VDDGAAALALGRAAPGSVRTVTETARVDADTTVVRVEALIPLDAPAWEIEARVAAGQPITIGPRGAFAISDLATIPAGAVRAIYAVRPEARR